MPPKKTLIPSDAIFNIKNQKQFEKIALQVFRYQYEHNVVYREFCNHLKINVLEIKSVRKIPFLPISFFKTHQIISGSKSIEQVFTSSGTTGATTSSHFVSDVAMYEKSYRYAFTQFYGNIQDYTILALLPSYLERTGSSLIYMVADLIAQSNNPDSGFYLNDHNKLVSKIQELEKQGKNTLLIGVTFGLLDVLDQYQLELHNTIVMETGGMKGRRKELIREELHGILCKGFGVSGIHSEYGMTELLSQAYSFGHGVFECPAWMQVLVRDTEDALSYVPNGKTGGINVIDLANIHSCSFIATQDLGKRYDNGTFEVLGRFDHSDIRGCNLMVL